MSEDSVILPDVGELVMGTVVRIVPYGAYVRLDEFNNAEGLLHISEISSRWVRNLREHVREGQKTVLKVLRVDATKLHIDLSLRRVSERERRVKLLQWKQDNRGRQLLSLAAEKMQVTAEEAYEKVGKLIEDSFGNIYLGLENAVENGDAILTKYGVPADWASLLTEIARMNIMLTKVKISGNLELTCTKPNGINILKNTFAKAKNVEKAEGSSVRLYTIGAPRYRVEIIADDYKEAEKLLNRVVQTAIKTIKGEGGEGKFTRGITKET